MRTFSLPRTHAARNWADCGLSDPKLIRSSIVYGSRENFRIVSVGPLSASGGMIALTRLPSGRRASTIGDDSSIRRPTWETILSMIRITCASSTNDASARSRRPSRSTKILSWAVDHDLGDGVVAEQRLQWAVAEHVVGDLALDPPPLLAGERRPVEGQLLGDRMEDALGEVLRALAPEELRPELRDHGVVDLGLQLRVRIDRAGLDDGGGCNGTGERGRTLGDRAPDPVAVLLLKPVVKTHLRSSRAQRTRASSAAAAGRSRRATWRSLARRGRSRSPCRRAPAADRG